MANLNLALDDIISSQRQSNNRGTRKRLTGGLSGGAGRLGVRRGGGGGGRGFGGRFSFSNDVPAGKWKHDKFSEIYGGNKGGSGSGNRIGGGRLNNNRRMGSKEIVKLNIFNLPETVITADLEELFQDFGVFGVVVHYDETGAHIGTADLFVDPQSAKDIIREFSNIAIDGQEIKFAVVDESAGKITIKDRIQRVVNNPIRNRKVVNPRRSAGAGPSRKDGGGAAAAAQIKKPTQFSAEELDKELEAYMSGRNTGKN